jgi:hypothetical protein
MAKKEFLILAKKKCIYSERIVKYLKENKYNFDVLFSDIDFQEKEFKDMYGQDATYPRVFEIKPNGKKIFFGDCTSSIAKLNT